MKISSAVLTVGVASMAALATSLATAPRQAGAAPVVLSAQPSLSGYTVAALPYDFATLAGKASSNIHVPCPEGTKVLGGGARLRDAENRIVRNVSITESGPIDNGWNASIVANNGEEGLPPAGTFVVSAICAAVAE